MRACFCERLGTHRRSRRPAAERGQSTLRRVWTRAGAGVSRCIGWRRGMACTARALAPRSVSRRASPLHLGRRGAAGTFSRGGGTALTRLTAGAGRVAHGAFRALGEAHVAEQFLGSVVTHCERHRTAACRMQVGGGCGMVSLQWRCCALFTAQTPARGKPQHNLTQTQPDPNTTHYILQYLAETSGRRLPASDVCIKAHSPATSYRRRWPRCAWRLLGTW